MSKEFVPEYDYNVVLYAESLGFDCNTVRGDFTTNEEGIAHYQKTMGLDFESACARYRQLIAEEVEEFLCKALGPRS